MVVVRFPAAEARRGRLEVLETLATPEFLLVDPVAPLDFSILLRASRFDVAMADPERLNGQREGEGKFVAIITLELPYSKRERSAELA